jgi:hypothetical protein
MGIFDLISDALHNRKLYKDGIANKSEVRLTTVGWRPDPINREDGFTPDPGNNCITGIDKVTGHYTYATPSGNREYSRVIRGGQQTQGRKDPDEWSETYKQWENRRKGKR